MSTGSYGKKKKAEIRTAKALNVLILTLVFPPDNVSTAQIMGNLAEDLQSLGHSVTVLTTSPHYNRDPEAEKKQRLRNFWGFFLKKSEYHGTSRIPYDDAPKRREYVRRADHLGGISQPQHVRGAYGRPQAGRPAGPLAAADDRPQRLDDREVAARSLIYNVPDVLPNPPSDRGHPQSAR